MAYCFLTGDFTSDLSLHNPHRTSVLSLLVLPRPCNRDLNDENSIGLTFRS